MRKNLITLLATGALLLPGAARAEWLKASSRHFVVYADDSERDIRKFSDQLERYHSAMAFVSSASNEAPSPSNRVTIYTVSGEREVQKLHGSGSRYVGGFYVPRAGGSLAIVPRITTGTTKLGWSMIVLLHEYAHHFMISESNFPMPRWYSEGGAEFFASASFERDGTVSIGRPATHRAAELLMLGFARDVKVAELLDPPASDKRKNSGYDAFYGKSWLLFHYLTFSEERGGQLLRYLQLIGRGKTSREAGIEAFGDFEKLDRDLNAYLAKSRMIMLTLRPDRLTTGPVEVSRLSAGEAAMMPVRIRSRIGVDEEEAKTLLQDARAVAARFPDDPAVLAALAEAEHDAGNDAEAIVAADAALAKDRSQVNAYIQKGLSLFRLAASDADPATAYRRAMAPFVALNRIENDHPLPLIYNYRALVEQGKTPDKLALNGLSRAVALAPFDLGLRMTLAMEQVQRRQFDPAKRTLAPVAYNPHGGGLAAAAQRVLARMEADPAWDGRDFAAVAGSTTDEEVATSQ
jgi:tetratricopeptide (TPR) repeat protein